MKYSIILFSLFLFNLSYASAACYKIEQDGRRDEVLSDEEVSVKCPDGYFVSEEEAIKSASAICTSDSKKKWITEQQICVAIDAKQLKCFIYNKKEKKINTLMFYEKCLPGFFDSEQAALDEMKKKKKIKY
jgi:hypothetical protein